jgi:GMP synthase-like glutamine amidotransferase
VSRTALILQHGDWGPPAILAEWCAARGIAFEVHHAQSRAPLPELNGQAFVASLGSPHNPDEEHVDQVAAEVAFIGEAVRRDVPVLGLCFGGQCLAHVLGGTVEPAPRPELGWREIETDDPDLVPAGPWLEWHYERFTTPPGATELARTEDAVQAFSQGIHLGVQFHPESTVEIVAGWAALDAERLAAQGIEDGAALLDAPAARHDAARAAAFELFDGFAMTRERA